MTSHTREDMDETNQRKLTELFVEALEATKHEQTTYGRAVAIKYFLVRHSTSVLLLQLFRLTPQTLPPVRSPAGCEPAGP